MRIFDSRRNPQASENIRFIHSTYKKGVKVIHEH